MSSFWLKSLGYSTLVIGTGVFLLKTTPPTPQPCNDQQKKLENDKKWIEINKMIKRNTESSSPAWDIKWYTK